MNLLVITLLLPFAGALLITLGRFGAKHPSTQDKIARLISIITPLASAALSLYLFFSTSEPFKAVCFDWISIGSLQSSITLLYDPLSSIIVLFITLISFLIFTYATGYMRGESGYSRFFIYFHLFLGSMLLLVLADNPLVMFIGWEGVGVCSYLLIGFYMDERANIAAANKAFYLNRIGDFGFISALALLFVQLGSNAMSYELIAAHVTRIDPFYLSLIGVLLFVGAMGKSAQIPLYVWLPDAMAGPTPVSALIHAATMVTAGVYMVVRFDFLYVLIPDIGLMIALIGTASAVLAALFASYASDIKKILAYSTMSQLGYMFAGAGLGAYSGAIFHLFNHAFFKALLFMGAGAVIITLHHQQNIFKMGHLRRRLPLISFVMLIATASISGIPPFSGFFSKDALISQAYGTGHYGIWIALMGTAFLTSFYMFRLYITVFIAPQSDHSKELLHPVAVSMKWPLVILAVAALGNGIWNLPHFMGFHPLMSPYLGIQDRETILLPSAEWSLSALNTALALAGATMAYRRFARRPKEPDTKRTVARVLVHKLYIDELYTLIVTRPLLFLNRIVNNTAETAIDNTIKALVNLYRRGAVRVNSSQDGDVNHYMMIMMLGISSICIYLLIIYKGA